ncbi:phosphotransferase system mannitol/fructose-specifc IIA component (Ntr-type) [Clostridium sartagoforme AAU1]|uniref:Phosphotransferase system mannitol/fructose-specifc IIA component (Ntr-type) n=1 Tax=Clostridium sartagoforme AAU1 TaxID=1202534 RepID=R9BUN7_9CLOT|nr:PTS sugar transporter subunit IIA [Clostridium sartagoforme]EOR20742.1 phosphotransferase system mannitol/fructose-specifc IIA component (Ntr-type) [Clostridium sartagoforme AAU1]
MSHSTLVYRDLNFGNSSEVLSFLADKLKEEGFAKEGYKEAILKREVEYPTGLPATIKIAIPHCDHTLVNESAIAMGVLNNPVDFQAMDDPSITLDVQIVIMLALNEPHGHIEMLQKIISLIQNAEDLKKIIEAKSDESLLEVINNYLN